MKSDRLTSIPTTFNVCALAREYGVSHSTIRRRIANGWTPAAALPVEIQPPPAKEQPGEVAVWPSAAMVAARGWPGVSAALIIVAIGIGAPALTINAQAGFRFGTTPLASVTFVGLSVAADGLAIVLPTAAIGLWHARRLGVAALAWLTWMVAAAMAVLGSLGFAELHFSDTAAGHHAIVAMSTAVTDQRTDGIAAAQFAADTATKAREAECGVRGPRCRDREADERAAIAALASAIAAPVPAFATIADANPQITAAVRLARWAGLKVTAEDFVSVRLTLMATLPNMAGLVLA
jgi:hypothetical protein